MSDERRNQVGPHHTPSTSLDNFEFTFNFSTTNLTGGSPIEPDPDVNRDDSESLTDSVLLFPEEFGRTYHAYRAGSYLYPNDLAEQERQSLMYNIIHTVFGGKLFFAPLDRVQPRAILDIATGTGEWAIQIGDYFPQATVVATDLSPIQPVDVPPNVNFYVEDSSEPWDYSSTFDYIHTRVTVGCWESFKTQIAEQAFENLSPGGWFEAQEMDCKGYCDDDTMTSESPVARWFDDMIRAAEATNRPIVVTALLRQALEEVGFVDVHERVYKIPLNSWPRDERLKDLGRMWEMIMVQGLSGMSLSLFSRAYSRTAPEIEVSLIDVRRHWGDPRVHGYMKLHVIWGRKPYPGESSSSRLFQQH